VNAALLNFKLNLLLLLRMLLWCAEAPWSLLQQQELQRHNQKQQLLAADACFIGIITAGRQLH
jgi:hypothetical protein